jgi:hypothetical protein
VTNNEILALASTVITVVAFILPIAAKVVGMFTERRTIEIDSADASEVEPHPGPIRADEAVADRLNDVRQALRREESSARAYRAAGSLLLFGQVIVGSVLASSFVQESLSKQVIGVLGLLVLTSSLLRQQYRPELRSVASRKRAVLLRSTLREVEDLLALHREGQSAAIDLGEIRKMLRDALSTIEIAQVDDSAAELGRDVSRKSPRRKRAANEN